MDYELPCLTCPYAIQRGIHVECEDPDTYDECTDRMDWEEFHGEDAAAGLEAYYGVPGL